MTTRQFSLTLSLAIYSDQTIIRHFFFLTKLLHTFAFDRHLSASNNYKTRRVNFSVFLVAKKQVVVIKMPSRKINNNYK